MERRESRKRETASEGGRLVTRECLMSGGGLGAELVEGADQFAGNLLSG